MPRKHLIISGSVQGVGFRYFAMREAERCGVTGWARNLPDGTVEMEAQGGDGALESFIQSMREGPRHSNVRKLEATPLPEASEDAGFNVRF